LVLILVLYSSQRGWWKIADFGLTSDGVTSLLRPTSLGRGTFGYRAPELLREELGYSKKTDIWSLGCIIYELCTRKPAFVNDFVVREFGSPTDINIRFLDGTSPEFRDTIRSTWLNNMLQRDHDNRPSIQFFADNFGALMASVIPNVVKPSDSWMSSHNVIATEGPVSSGILSWEDVFVPGTHEQHKATMARCERIRTTRDRLLGADHHVSHWSTKRLAWVYLMFDAYKEAESLFQDIIKIQEQNIGRFHPNTLASRYALAACCYELEDKTPRKEAYRLYQEVLDLQIEHGIDENETLKTRVDLAEWESHLGDARVADQETANILTRRRSILGECHPDTLRSTSQMAWSYLNHKDFENACSWFSRAGTIARRVLGMGHPQTAISIVGLAVSNHDRGRPNLLELLEALEAARRIFGEGNNPYTDLTRAKLVQAFRGMQWVFPG
jgi:tetratricopeptide (TPR) repeat protein